MGNQECRLATALLDRLSSILPDDQKSKLISQAYDGANVMKEATGGMQKKVQDVYVNAHYDHCFRDSLPTLCREQSGSVSQQQLAKKHCTLGLCDLQRVATEVR